MNDEAIEFHLVLVAERSNRPEWSFIEDTGAESRTESAALVQRVICVSLCLPASCEGGLSALDEERGSWVR